MLHFNNLNKKLRFDQTRKVDYDKRLINIKKSRRE